MTSELNMTNDDSLLKEDQAGEFLQISPRTLQAWRGQGKGPRFCAAGGAIRYQRSDLVEWIRRNLASSTSAKKKTADARASCDRQLSADHKSE
jgi:predicted DNA-binding transcriptional regulator AlpA